MNVYYIKNAAERASVARSLSGVTHLEDHRPKDIATGRSDRHDEKYQCSAAFTSATILDQCHHFRMVVARQSAGILAFRWLVQRCEPDFPLCAGIDPALSSVDHLAEDRLPELLIRPHDVHPRSGALRVRLRRMGYSGRRHTRSDGPSSPVRGPDARCAACWRGSPRHAPQPASARLRRLAPLGA